MNRIFKSLVYGQIGLVAAATVFAVDNPVKVMPAGSLVRHNGIFYGIGAQTNAHMMVSTNLMEWVPSRALQQEPGETYELMSHNGLYYLYSAGFGCAFAEEPDLPFSPLRKNSVKGEDLRMFEDESGQLLAVSRNSGVNDGGQIRIQSCREPWQASRHPRVILDGRDSLWDSLETAELGEPDLLSYRGHYYLLYASNRPGPRTGQREIGVVMNEKPQAFENEMRRLDPVMVRNVERLARQYQAILPSGEYREWEGRYTTKQPDSKWALPEQRLSGWRTGDGGFGYPDEIDGTPLRSCRTKWKESQIWVRRTFELSEELKTPVLNIRHEGAVQVFLNGRKVFEMSGPTKAYANFDLSKRAAGLFRPGENVLAVHAVGLKPGGVRFLDFGLYDAEGAPVEPTVYGVDNPRFMTGPNGFEKWLGYSAFWNGVAGNGLDRVYFIDEEMMVDGPTTRFTPGYHPPPALPTFSDLFPVGVESSWEQRWQAAGGEWMEVDGVLRQTNLKVAGKAYLKQPPAKNYLFETDIRFAPDGKGRVGVVAWSNGEKDFVIGINPSAGTWSYRLEPGRVSQKSIRLPKVIKLGEVPPGAKARTAPQHRLRVEKNGSYFEVFLDGVKLTRKKPIFTELAGAGVPGLYCSGVDAEFDGVVYTVGWDEHNEYITGWGAAADGTKPGGLWRHEKRKGLTQRRFSDTGRAFKGDLLDQYEFTVNARTDELHTDVHKFYGVFPVFADRNNYIKAVIHADSRQLVVTGKLNGREIKPLSESLSRRIPVRPIFEEDEVELSTGSWLYPLPSTSIITGLDVRWLEGEYDALEEEFFLPRDEMRFTYGDLDKDRDERVWDRLGHFNDADEPRPRPQKSGELNRIALREETGNYVGMEIYSTASSVGVFDRITGGFLRWLIPGDGFDPELEILGDPDSNEVEGDPARPQETLVSVAVESSYFFRCVKLKDRVIIELNGQPMIEVEGAWPPSQVGLVTEGVPCSFNGMTLHHLPAE